MLSKRTGVVVLVSLTLVVIIAAILAPRIAQPLAYHNFADRRAWLDIPNFGDVVSNAGFAIVGLWGLVILLGEPSRVQFVDSRERWPYVIVFAGMILTAIGSSYYHLAPDNDRLVWDRLPMTIVFMALVAAMIIERISVPIGLALLPLLLLIGIASVVAVAPQRDKRGKRSAVLCCVAGLCRVAVARDSASATTLHAQFRPGGGSWLLCFGENYRGSGPPDFCVWPCGKRPHHQASCRGCGGIVDLADAAKATACGTPGTRLNRLRKNSHFVIRRESAE